MTKKKPSQYETSSETDDYSFSHGEKANILKEYGFDGLFGEDGTFNAARATEEDNRIESQPIALHLGAGTTVTQNQKETETAEESSYSESEEMMEQEKTSSKKVPKQAVSESKAGRAQPPSRLLNIKTKSNVVAVVLNRLSETTVMEVADALVKYPIGDCADAILDLLQDLDTQSCLLPTLALLLFALKTLMSLSDYRQLVGLLCKMYQQSSVQYQNVLLLLSYTSHYGAFSALALQQLIYSKSLSLSLLLRSLRVADRLRIERNRVSLDTDGVEQDIAQVQAHLLADICEQSRAQQRQQASLYQQSYHVVLHQQATLIRQQAVQRGLRAQAENEDDTAELSQYEQCVQKGVEREQEQAELQAKRLEHQNNQLTQKSRRLLTALTDVNDSVKQAALLMANTQGYSEDACIAKLQRLVETNSEVQHAANYLVRLLLAYIQEQDEYLPYYGKVFRTFQTALDGKLQMAVQCCFWDFFRQLPTASSQQVIATAYLLVDCKQLHKILGKSLICSQVQGAGMREQMFFDIVVTLAVRAGKESELPRQLSKEYEAGYIKRMAKHDWKQKIEAVCDQK